MGAIPGVGLKFGMPMQKLTESQFMAQIAMCKLCRRWIVPGRHEREWRDGRVSLGLVHKGGCP